MNTRISPELLLAVPQDREGAFSTKLFSRYQRNEEALCYEMARADGRVVSQGA